MAKTSDGLKKQLARTVITEVLERNYLVGWLQTLGEVGAPPKKGAKNVASAQARVSAAKVGVEFVTKFLGDAEASEAGSELLKEIQNIQAQSEAVAGTGQDWPEDTDN